MLKWALFPFLPLMAGGLLAQTAGVGTAPKAVISQPLIADNPRFLALYGTTNDDGKFKETYQNVFHVKVPATNLLFPFAQSYSDWNLSENEKDFSNPATYRAAISVNRGPWTQLTWGGAKSKLCPFHEVIVNDPVPVTVKAGDAIYVRTEITVPPGGKWGLGPQATGGDPKAQWSEGGTKSADDVLLSDQANFFPDVGKFTHTAQGVFGTPVGAPDFAPAIILGDSVSPYVLGAAAKIGNQAPLAYFGQPNESADRFWNAGYARQRLLGGYEVMLYQYGVNDLRTGVPFATMKTDAQNIWAAFRAAGGKHLIVFTLTPLSSSTDHWVTEKGQTPGFEPAARTQYNDFVRGLTDRDVGMKLTVIDTAALFESTRNNSLWKPTADGKAMTDDGCHPNDQGYRCIELGIGDKTRAAIVANE